MLERVSSPAECAAHIFLRTVEKPVKSQRSLGRSFWRHGGEQMDMPTWWLGYLTDIRKSSNGHVGLLQLSSTTPHSSSSGAITSSRTGCGRLAATATRQVRHVQAPDRSTRSFTDCVSHNSRVPVPAEVPKTQATHRNARKQDTLLKTQKNSAADNMIANLLDEIAGEDKQSAYPASIIPKLKADPDYKKAWTLFIQSGHKQDISSSVFHLMAQSYQRIHLLHALKVFDFIPTTQRAISDYEAAIDVALKLKRYKTAISLISQALAKGQGENVYFKFMAFCVSHMLWNTLASLWKLVGTAGRVLIQSTRSQSGSKSPNIAGNYTFHFDTIDDFAGKVLSLADRLAGADAVLAANRRPLVDICKRLAYIAAESQQVMATITGSQALALFGVQEKLQFNSKLHIVAIGAIKRMRDRGSRSQLALLIYRNLRFASADTIVPRWVYGALIGICADGRQPAEVYKYLLDEIEQQYGEIDHWSQQQALAACAQQGEVAAVFDLFEHFCQSGEVRDLRDVHHLLHVFAVVGDCTNTQNQFDRLTSDFGLQPNVVSWSILLLAHARSTHPETTFDCFEKMKLAGVTPNTISWSILISVAAKRGNVEHARRLYEQARQQNVPGSIYMVGSMVDSLLSNKEPEQAEAIVFEASKMKSRESPIRLWNSLLRYYAFRSDMASISRVQILMKEYKIEPDHMTYAALMTALVMKGQTSGAAKLLRTLQISRRLQPTEFHYSILVQGYVQEGKRDLATTMYHEMLGRYPRGSASAKLAMLRLQLRRDLDAMRNPVKLNWQKDAQSSTSQVRSSPWHGVDYLANVLLQDPRIDAASPVPNPGFRRHSARDGLEAIYFGSLISFLQQNMAHPQAEALLDTVESLKPLSGTSPRLKLTNMAFRMTIGVEKKDWVLVDELWKQLCRLALELYCDPQRERLSQPAQSQHALMPHGISLLGSHEETFRPMVPMTTVRHIPQISRAHQYALSWPLSVYLQALDFQGRYGEVIASVIDFENLGFALSSRNWNRYIQVLSKSSQFDHQLLAFQQFENRMFQGQSDLRWDLIRRGKHILPVKSRFKKSSTRLSLRKKLERSDPGILMPSYFTMIHLAASIMKIYRSISAGDTSMMEQLRSTVPRTLKLVQQVPYLADRVQGVLLRGRGVLGDREPRPRSTEAPFEETNQNDFISPLDRLPVSALPKAIALLAARGNFRERVQSSETTFVVTASEKQGSLQARLAEYVRREEARSGSIHRSPIYVEKYGRHENDSEMQQRIRLQEQSKLQPYIDLAEEAFGKIHRRRQFLQAQGRKETDLENERRVGRQTLQYLEWIEDVRAELQMPSSSHGVYRNDIPPSLPSQDGVSRQPNAMASRHLANALLHNPGTEAALHIIKARIQDSSPSDGSGEAKVEAHGSETGFTKVGRSLTGQKSSASKSSPVNSSQQHILSKMMASKNPSTAVAARIVAGRLLTRRIVPRYQNRNIIPPKRLEPRRRGAWSINKALRRSKLQNKQSYDRWQLQIRKELETRRQDSIIPKTGTTDEAVSSTAKGKGGRDSAASPVSRVA